MKNIIYSLIVTIMASQAAIAAPPAPAELKKVISEKIAEAENKVRKISQKVESDLRKIASTVDVQYLTDGNQEGYFIMKIQLKSNNVPDFSINVPHTSTTIGIQNGISSSTLSFIVYEKDLEAYAQYENLEMPENRIFPINIDGKIYRTMFGHREIVGGEVMDCYLDGSKDIFGGYISFEKAGGAIDVINALKDQIKYISFLPDLDHISAPIIYKGKLIGHVSLVGNDAHGRNSGLLIRLSPSRIKSLK